MERGKCEDGTQKVADERDSRMPSDLKSNASYLTYEQSSGDVENEDSVDNFASSTPLKTMQQSTRCKKTGFTSPAGVVKQLSKDFMDEGVIAEDVETEVPKKYRILVEFLDRIDTAVKLLALRKKPPTFQNICNLVEVLSKRKLSCNNLAQIKYILPEAIKIEKIIVHNEKTLCMTPEMTVKIQLDAIEAHPHKSAYMSLRQVFCARLLHILKGHSEEYDIPAAMLPEPFNQKDPNVLSIPLQVESRTISREGHVDEQEQNPSIPVTRHLSPQLELSDSDTVNFLKDVGGIEASALKNEELVIPSSLSQSIRRHFSRNLNILEEEKTQLIAVPVPSLPANDGADANQNTMNPQQESHGLVLETTSMRSPVELIFGEQCHSAAACESSPLKPVEVSHKLMSETPAQQTPPKRSLACLSDKISSEADTTSQATAKRSLSFSVLQDDSSTSCATIDKSKQCDNEGLPSSENIFTEDSIISFSGISQMVGENQKPKKSTLQKHRQIASLDGLFSLTINIFKSVNRSLITKQELLQKIISDDLDIVDEREAEEQLALLEELIPDWICRKTISSGDTMYSIRKESDAESIRSRLAESI
ncbi:hypothetical protein Scep_015899 [Stephania cephalantha]|uniref:CDT1 Geminin-binding domain-containing protein n=1 Tax=Stephania cephalantha TaxID=152367 RepID=A0AAP0NVA1_9MAGN